MNQHWTQANIPDLTGKVIIVTGANSGIGLESTREFARKGATVILACRNLSKADSAITDIKADIPDARLAIIQLDLASLASVRAFVSTFKAQYTRLDILLNNAGILWLPYGQTEDGFEQHFAVNHLGHFALTGLLLDYLLTTDDARIVTVASHMHRSGRLDWNNLVFDNGQDYTRFQVYARTKLANLLFAYELQRRLVAKGADTISLAAHPGSSNTSIVDENMRKLGLLTISKWLAPLFIQSAAMGALPSLRAAVDPQARGGTYYGPHGFMGQRGYPVLTESSAQSHDEADAKRLWEISEALTEVVYDFSHSL
ncbi:MAG: oxidoreductase [Chloroflexota bacterium]